MMNILAAILSLVLAVPVGDSYLKNLQQRDSVLVADQLEYGFEIKNAKGIIALGFPDFSAVSNDTLTLVRDWQVDSLNVKGKPVKKGAKPDMLRASVVLVPFEAARYNLPDIPVLCQTEDGIDTLVFKGREVEVKYIPLDSTFVFHDIKEQITYPVTFAEVAPVAGGSLAGAAILAGLVLLVVSLLGRKKTEQTNRDPAYIVALRDLEKFRGKEHWEPDNQKAFYSGVTDILKFYMEDRFGIDAPEMTTAELFDALKTDGSLSPELYEAVKDLFERADFVKFAKHLASEEENAAVLPLSIRFVTTTYVAEEEAAAKAEMGGNA